MVQVKMLKTPYSGRGYARLRGAGAFFVGMMKDAPGFKEALSRWISSSAPTTSSVHPTLLGHCDDLW